MFNRLSFKGQPETFTLTLGYSDSDHIPTSPRSIAASRGTLTQETATIKWTSQESEQDILQRIEAASNDPDIKIEHISVIFTTADTPGNIVSAASYDNEIKVELRIESSQPILRSIQLLKDTTGTISTAIGLGIWSTLDVSRVTRMQCTEGASSLWDAQILHRFSSLKVLDLSHANLNTLPGVIGTLTQLEELRLVGNHLKILPPDLGKLTMLKVLAVDSNEISILPGELRKCSMLEELTLENNRLSSVLLNFGAMHHLKTLLLSGNPLEFLPEISPCQDLRTLSVANLRVHANDDYSQYDVELVAPTSQSSTINISLFDSKPTDKLRPIFSLMLRRSTGHHPLLAGAFRHLAEDIKNRELMAKQENAFQQLILMALNDDSEVVDQTCKTLALLASHSPSIAESIINADAGSLVGLLRSPDEKKQLASLGVLAAISLSSSQASDKMLTKDLLSILLSLSQTSRMSIEVRIAALRTLGNLAFTSKGKSTISTHTEIMDLLLDLSKGLVLSKSNTTTTTTTTSLHASHKHNNSNKNNKSAVLRVSAAAIRVLAILGDTSAVGKAIGRPPPRGRGLRVLSLDGGGMKGMATVQLLRRLEAAAGNRPIHELFDLIVGTSTGGLLAVAIGLRKFSMDECEDIYKVLGQRVFSRPVSSKEKDESWMETFYRTFHSKTQHVRAVVVGYKHDAAVYETLLKEYCSFKNNPQCLSDTLIDTAALDVPKIALVSTLASYSPATPFVFRNYELPVSSNKKNKLPLHPGSSKHAVWQAVRASSAAIYYLDDFTCGNDKFQDGAVVANNPGVIAVQEARAIWPDIPIEVFVSVGTGSTPTTRRDKGISAFVDTGNILIESATNVDRVHEALATMAPLMPKMKYFRFNPVDERCSMELDEIDEEKWSVLETATEDFIKEYSDQFDEAGAALLGYSNDDDDSDGDNNGDDNAMKYSNGYHDQHTATTTTNNNNKDGLSSPLLNSRGSGGVANNTKHPTLVLGLHRSVFVVTSPSLAGEQRIADAVAASCARLPSCCKYLDLHVAVASVDSSSSSTITHEDDTTHGGNTVSLLSSPIHSPPPPHHHHNNTTNTTTTTTTTTHGSVTTTPVSSRRKDQQTLISSHAIHTHSTTSLSLTNTTINTSDNRTSSPPPHTTTINNGGVQQQSGSIVDVDIGSAIGSVFSWFSPSKPTTTTTTDTTDAAAAAAVSSIEDKTTKTATPSSSHHPSPAPSPSSTRALAISSPTTTTTSPSHTHDHQHQQQHQQHESSSLTAVDIFEHELASCEPGIIHIALTSCSAGLVLKWKDSFAAIHIPSKEANDLMIQAMKNDSNDDDSDNHHHQGMSLLEYFEKKGGQIMVGNTAVRLVSTQYRRSPVSGQLTAIALVQYTTAEEVFDAVSIKKMRSVLHGKLVVCTDAVINECIDAFLSVGVLAVIAPTVPLEHVAGCNGSITASFLSQFYSDVQNGGDCVKALKRAETVFSSLANVFKLYQ